jgi:mutual gliding-motility protein MglA
LQFNKRDLQNVAPTNYLEYLLNNRKRRVQSFECVASTGVNVFSSLDALTQLLLHKFKKENTQLFPGPGKQPVR